MSRFDRRLKPEEFKTYTATAKKKSIHQDLEQPIVNYHQQIKIMVAQCKTML